MNDKTQEAITEDGVTTQIVEIRGRKFTISELTFGQMNKLNFDTNKQDGEQKALAVSNQGGIMIALSVTENGKSLTFEDVQGMPLAMAGKLLKAVVKINGLGDDAEDEAKKS